jgi:uncharacterized membrane protein YGL010W
MGFIESYQASHTHPVNRALHSVGIPMIVVSIVMFIVDLFMMKNLWPIALGLFVFGWILQFIGHAFEGKPPAFFKNPLFLLVGVKWWFLKMIGKK